MEKELFDQKFLTEVAYIQEIKIFNEIQNRKKILIIDLRKREEYDALHLELSINLPYNEYDDEFFFNLFTKKNQNWSLLTNDEDVKKRLKDFKRYFIAIVMSEEKIKRRQVESFNSDEIDTEESNRIIKSLLLYKCLKQNGVREKGIYNSGISKFKTNYNFLLCTYGNKPIIK